MTLAKCCPLLPAPFMFGRIVSSLRSVAPKGNRWATLGQRHEIPEKSTFRIVPALRCCPGGATLRATLGGRLDFHATPARTEKEQTRQRGCRGGRRGWWVKGRPLAYPLNPPIATLPWVSVEEDGKMPRRRKADKAELVARLEAVRVTIADMKDAMPTMARELRRSADEALEDIIQELR